MSLLACSLEQRFFAPAAVVVLDFLEIAAERAEEQPVGRLVVLLERVAQLRVVAHAVPDVQVVVGGMQRALLVLLLAPVVGGELGDENPPRAPARTRRAYLHRPGQEERQL